MGLRKRSMKRKWIKENLKMTDGEFEREMVNKRVEIVKMFRKKKLIIL